MSRNLTDLLHVIEIMFPGEDLSGSLRIIERMNRGDRTNEAVA